nr:MAG TPA: hypothetical protein [Crassvirales sp.]
MISPRMKLFALFRAELIFLPFVVLSSFKVDCPSTT